MKYAYYAPLVAFFIWKVKNKIENKRKTYSPVWYHWKRAEKKTFNVYPSIATPNNVIIFLLCLLYAYMRAMQKLFLHIDLAMQANLSKAFNYSHREWVAASQSHLQSLPSSISLFLSLSVFQSILFYISFFLNIITSW